MRLITAAALFLPFAAAIGASPPATTPATSAAKTPATTPATATAPAATTTTATTTAATAPAELPEHLSPTTMPSVDPKMSQSLQPWIPQSVELLLPVLTEDEKKSFDKQFGADIAAADKGDNKLKLSEAEILAHAAQSMGVSKPQLAFSLRVEAHRLTLAANGPLPFRAEVIRAMATNYSYPIPTVVELRLEALRIRTKAFDLLCRDAGVAFTPALLDQDVVWNLRLAIGYQRAVKIKEAIAALDEARKWVDREKTRRAQMAFTVEMVARTKAAEIAYAKARTTLLQDPKDAESNALVATIYLALFNDLPAAIPFAHNASRADLVHLAAAYDDFLKNQGALIQPPIWQATFNLCDAVRGVAAATKDPTERFLIAAWALQQFDFVEPLSGVKSNEDRLTDTTMHEKIRSLTDPRPASLPEFRDNWSISGALLK